MLSVIANRSARVGEENEEDAFPRVSAAATGDYRRQRSAGETEPLV